MKTIIRNAVIVNEGQSFLGSLIVENDRISNIIADTQTPHEHADCEVDATGCFLLPGVIDEHVHFRDPGLTYKADMATESIAAAYGGVTTFFDMPNTVPQTTNFQALDDKFKTAAQESRVNYSFFFGATNDNADLLPLLDPHRIPGVKVFMGSSTGNMLVDREAALEKIFSNSSLPIMAHCEDTGIINNNMKAAKMRYGDDPNISLHPIIRSVEACYASTLKAVTLAKRLGTRLHVAHLTTEKELDLFGDQPNITAEAVVAHLYFTDKDYQRLGALIKCNPSVKTITDRTALRKALTDGRITTVATDHAPHLLSEKQGGAAKALSGMPMIQFSLVTMLELVEQGELSIEQMVKLMCHQPATLFQVRERGFLRKDYKADMVIVRGNSPWKLSKNLIQSKCKWSPMLGHTFNWKVTHTFCNGHLIYNNGRMDNHYRGEAVCFR